ncbi:MAG: 2,3-bisphosphoglycerate-independent phosphoglycerate mutase [Gammaproteobacteria bacterium]|nr:2,3-bisphosphoglycerate-independent phosphoglycerate mutase [Gammaproteobacteria bacterium]
MASRPRPVVLTVLDGWGYSEKKEGNAILAARTPNWDRLWNQYAHGLVNTSGIVVGLPSGQMGNSEVGHLNLGAGRVVFQDYTRVTEAIADGSFEKNPAMLAAIEKTQASGGAVHVMGLLSPGGVHSHEEHIHALIQMLAHNGVNKVFVHAMLDGRDMPPRSAGPSLKLMEKVCADAGAGRIASLCGRYYAMDRDKRWDRVKKAWDMYVHGTAHTADSAAAGLAQAYDRDESDEFVQPTLIADEGGDFATVTDGDAIIFMNYRADRARELSHAFVDEKFDGFERGQRPALVDFVSLTQYEKGLATSPAFPPVSLSNTLGAYAASLGLRQLRIAETEKYAHVTFFFNGGEEAASPGEDRILVQSPKVATYDLQPEMSAPEMTDKMVEAIRSGKYDLIISNYANADMVGHSGNFDAAVKAIEALDDCIGRVADTLVEVGGELLVTADHGNAEQMSDAQTGQAHTAHTTNPVPLLYVGRKARVADDGALADIAPTLLGLMGLDQPEEMTGRPLITLED